ncbi:hypothetical protein [Psychroserpens jangbogonensis]|uniref:hypothetical protein n=1 Tax=Psychroserpens jangbogonensis TaxID=1484460 RepID=UPI00068FB3EC|nr:hypothetical protein [Psychroserpens jangbogonensis]
MKTKLYTLLVTLFATATMFAQAPEKLSYQAVVRDAGNAIVSNQAVGMQISILQDATAVYVETQTPTTNANGLISIEIGMGSVVSGDFSTIDWSAGPYFIKTETDPTGGTSYTITGTSELLSVPYALHAKDVDKGIYENIISNANFTFTMNQITQFDVLAKTILLDKESDVLITYNTNAYSPTGNKYFNTSVFIDGSENRIFTKRIRTSNSGGASSVSNSCSGVVRLAAGTHTIVVNYSSNFDPNGANGRAPSSLTIKELK